MKKPTELNFRGILMNLSKNQQKYIDEMGSHAHNCAVEIIGELEAENKRLADRDGSATIRLAYKDERHPFGLEELKIVDVGVSDNIYIVESKLVVKLQKHIEDLVNFTDIAHYYAMQEEIEKCHRRIKELEAETKTLLMEADDRASVV